MTYTLTEQERTATVLSCVLSVLLILQSAVSFRDPSLTDLILYGSKLISFISTRYFSGHHFSF